MTNTNTTINETVRAKVMQARVELNAAFIDRETEIDVLLLALLAGEHACLLGPAGTGKSELLRKIASILDVHGEDYFEIAFSKFTTPEQFLGPFKYTAIQQDVYERNTANRLPRAMIAFLDEVWKCAAALNALLPIMCEGTFENGGTISEIPLRFVCSASNELPEDDSLGALFDRYLFRHYVRPIQGDVGRAELFRRAASSSSRRKGAVNEVNVRLTREDWDTMCSDVCAVGLTDDVTQSLLAFRTQLERDGIEHGDRRWVKAVRALQAKAYLSGDSWVDEEHFIALVPCMWTERDQIEKIETAAKAAINPLVGACREIHTAARDEANRLIGTGKSEEMFRAPTVMKMAGDKIRARRDATSGKARDRIEVILSTMADEFATMKETIKCRHAEKFANETL
jgi:MoxR-like ATPase